MHQEHSNSLSTAFQETERFLHTLKPPNYTPPFISTTFNSLRRTTFQNLPKEIVTQKESLFTFISKFEVEYIDTLRAKLLDHYTNYILKANYQVPEQVSMKELEIFGTNEELRHFAVIVAELAIELEISSYTVEGLELYGLIEPQNEIHKDYFKALKQEYSYKKKNSSKSILKWMLESLCEKTGPVLFEKEVGKTGIREKDVIDMIVGVINGSAISWNIVTNTLNLTWLLGRYTYVSIMQRLKDYTTKKEVMSSLIEIQRTLVSNRIRLLKERKSVLDLVEKALKTDNNAKYRRELNVLVRAVEVMFRPQRKSKMDEHEGFKVKEEEEMVVVDEAGMEEFVDESGVVIVD